MTTGSASSLTSSERAQTTAATSSRAGETTATRSRLRKPPDQRLLLGLRDEHERRLQARAPSEALAVFVDGASNDAAETIASVPPSA